MSQPLSYESDQSARHRRRFWRRIALWFGVALAVTGLIAVFQDVPERMKLMYEQSRFAVFAFRVNQVVYADAPRPSSALGIVVTHSEVIKRWEDFSDYQANDSATLFIHERTCPGASPRLVGVICNGRSGAYMTFFVDVIEPGTIRRRPRSHGDVYFLRMGNNLKIYGGQPDASDSRHFTIGYEADGKLGIIDGWLEINDTVKLEPRR